MFRLLALSRRIHQQVGIAEDRGHGGADFVAHVARNRLLATLATSAWRRASMSFNSNCLLDDDPPPAVHEKLELADVAFVVVCRFVSDAGDGDDPLAVEYGNIHVADDRHVPLGRAPLERIRRGIVVGNDRFPLADRLAPEPRLLHGINDRLVDDFAGFVGRL